ncbi:hypothetical protein M407DRAFT_71063 [Tulasnella calospora MUT 4182]|uniref:OPT superfamily oligopeptide transporter n=1 Tax=Tulasnella calospora MUT 4182 TaxID=1051891 RepID=A0A0C3L5F6_9AGAM|nr:hypothetical protein M407DRAFT_71063 [Tulasnella calospora MUT 4182]
MDDEEDSPYAEVRASVSNVDDPDMPCLTWRMWAIGLVLSVLLSGGAMYFTLRYPSPSLTYTVLIVCIYLLGKALELLPIRSWNIGPFVFELNPGPFNIKEHTAAFILSAMSGPSLSMAFLVASEKKFNVKPSLCFQILLPLACQLAGFSLGGTFRHLLVRPASLIWPGNLSTCAMMNMFHAAYDDAHSHRGLARPPFFAYAALGAAVYSFIPGYLFTGLSYFSFLCWIWPNNRVVNQLFGTVTGLGMTGLTFDWSQITSLGNPLTTPWWAMAHIFAGFVTFYWVILPLLYYLDVWKTGHLPIMGYFAYDRFARPYDIDRVIDRNIMRLNATAYEEYSQLYLPVSFSVTYMLAFISPALLVTHVALNYGPNLQRWFFDDKSEEPDDIHAKLMQRYPDTPTWWYLVLFAFSFSLLPIALKIEHDMDTPVWMALSALVIVIIFFLPMAYLYATAGCIVAINVIPEATLGILLPGRALPNMMFKTTVMDICILGLACLGWLKLGHYMKIPPRINFCVQIVGILVSTFTQLVIKNKLFAAVKDICQPEQKNQLTCAPMESGYTASVVWGMIGPARLYGRRGLYFPQVFGLLIGALLPIPFWWWSKRRPKSPLRHVHLPTFFYSYVGMPPATGINQASFFLVGFIFQYVLRRRRFQWWSRYNYVLAGALDIGTIFGLLLLFFSVQLPRQGKAQLNWWGNTVWQKSTLC